MEFSLRDINPKNHDEIDLVVHRAMETVLETIPEFEGSPANVKNHWSNFTFEQMKHMFIKDYSTPNHRTLLVINEHDQKIIGHAICSIKTDKNNEKYGFCFSRFIHKGYRKKGMATALLKKQEEWWIKNEVNYILAQTHESNNKLKGLFIKNGFNIEGPIHGSLYNYYILKKHLKN